MSSSNINAYLEGNAWLVSKNIQWSVMGVDYQSRACSAPRLSVEWIQPTRSSIHHNLFEVEYEYSHQHSLPMKSSRLSRSLGEPSDVPSRDGKLVKRFLYRNAEILQIPVLRLGLK